jgi:coenzyme F420-dependent glucose-6-phosphate dehydrogenase
MPAGIALGLHCSHEQHPPSQLLRHLKRAAARGYTAAMCSDHFAPWSERQGHSGYAWSWLGAALEATSMSLGVVCAPGQRYHPAVIAQAAATLAEMYPERFWLAVGSGEALNEQITGDPWPPKQARNERLEQSVRVMRALWAGETVTLRGHTITTDARLYSRAAQPPLVFGAALSAETARWVGTWADGLITVAGPRSGMKEVVDAFRETAGQAKPMCLQVALSFAPSDREATQAALDQWRHCGLDGDQLADLRTPAAFDAASAGVSADQVLSRVRVSADLERHKQWLREDMELGFDRIYLHNVAREHQDFFIDAAAGWLGH